MQFPGLNDRGQGKQYTGECQVSYLRQDEPKGWRGGDPGNEWVSRKFTQETTKRWGSKTLRLGQKFSVLSSECL